MILIIVVLIIALVMETIIIIAYNKPNFELNITRGEDFDTYRLYFNYIHYKEYLEYSEKENRTVKLLTFRRKHKNDKRRT